MKKIIGILTTIKKILLARKNTCRIINIDIKKQEVVFQLKMRSTIFRLPINEAIFRFGIIEMLTPMEACWLGGHYGRQRNEILQRPASKHAQQFAFKKSDAFYKLIAQNRDQTIIYFDTRTKKTWIEHPTTIVNNDWIMSKFDTMQAYYIGFLAGIAMERKDFKAPEKTAPTLRIV